MAFGLAHDKLWSVHLNDQGGLKFDQDKSFGSYNLRHAFNQVRVLEEYSYGRKGEWGRVRREGHAHPEAERGRPSTSPAAERASSICSTRWRRSTPSWKRQMKAARDYEELDRYIMCHLMGVKYS